MENLLSERKSPPRNKEIYIGCGSMLYCLNFNAYIGSLA